MASTTINYSPVTEVPPLSESMARWFVAVSLAPAVGGMLILAAYWFTAHEVCTVAGIIWFLAGGLAAASIFVIAVTNIIRAMSRRPRDRRVAGLYGRAIGGVGLSVAVAFACVCCWANWFLRPHVLLTAANGTTTMIDRLVIHFASGDIDSGSLAPGETKSLGSRWLLHRGPLEITVTANGRSRRKLDRPETDLVNEKQPEKRRTLEIIVEAAELPKAAF